MGAVGFSTGRDAGGLRRNSSTRIGIVPGGPGRRATCPAVREFSQSPGRTTRPCHPQEGPAMRTLAAALLLALAASTLSAADKDEDKAKEVTAAFLKAVKAKDLDAVMKTVDVPFLSDDKDGVKVIEKTEDLKA